LSWPCACALWLGSSDLGKSPSDGLHGRADGHAASFPAQSVRERESLWQGTSFVAAIPSSSLQPHIRPCYCPGSVAVPNPVPRLRSRCKRKYFSSGPLPPATETHLLVLFQRCQSTSNHVESTFAGHISAIPTISIVVASLPIQKSAAFRLRVHSVATLHQSRPVVSIAIPQN